MTGNDYTDEDWLNDYDINYLHSKLTEKIIKIYYEVYNTLGFGFLEQVYQNALYFALMKEGYTCKAQYPIDVYFEDQLVGQYKADIIVNDTIILELKACKTLSSAHVRQLYNYLRATNYEVGLLLNFGEEPQVVRRVAKNKKSHKSS